MATASSTEALLTEHLHYTPLTLIDDVINTVNAIVYRASSAIETGLLRAAPEKLGYDQPSIPIDADTPPCDNPDPRERQRVEVEEGVHRLETLLESTVDKDFDKFEIYTLRNILWVPDGLEDFVRLRHYENLQLPLTASTATPTSIQTLRQRLQATQQLNLTLLHTHASNEQLLTQLRSVLTSPHGSLSHLNITPSEAASSTPAATTTPTNLSASAQFTKAQLPALKALLDDLRPRLKTLSDLAENGAKPGKLGEKRDERVQYVENVVDRVVDTQLGATREGDQMLGRGRTEEEVRAMERIAAASGKGTGAEMRREEEGEDEAEEMEE